MNEKPLISIIIPVHNEERYIEECLISICNQTYKNIEILVVENGSNDGSPDVCNEYAKKDNRIVFISLEDAGLSSARNAALRIAKGDYYMFVDSDDWVEPDFCETALDVLQKNNVSMVSFGHDRIYENPVNGLTKKVIHIKEPRKMSASEAIEYAVYGKLIYNFVWNKISSRELFDGIEFPVGRSYEDGGFTYKLIDRAGVIYVSDKVLYHYRRHRHSITASWYTPEYIKDRFQMWAERLEYLTPKYPELHDCQIRRLAYEGMYAFKYNKGEKYNDFLQEVESFFKTNKSSILKNCKSIFFKCYFYCRPLVPLYFWFTDIYTSFLKFIKPSLKK